MKLIKTYLLCMVFFILFSILRNKKNNAELLLKLKSFKRNKKLIRLFNLVLQNYGIFFGWMPFWGFIQINLYRFMIFLSIKFPSLAANRNILLILPSIICFFLQPLISICVIAQFQRKIKKRKLVFIPGILVGTAKYMPAYILSIIKQAFSFPKRDLMLRDYSLIYFIMEGGGIDSRNRESVFIKRVTQYSVNTLLETTIICGFLFQLSVEPIIYWSWHMSDPLIVIIRYLFILILVLFNFLKVFLVVYMCYLYLWHRKWEETYKDILAAGKAAPNIETVEFPKL